MQTWAHLLQVVVAAGDEEALWGVAAPPEEGGQAGQARVHPQEHQDQEGLNTAFNWLFFHQ